MDEHVLKIAVAMPTDGDVQGAAPARRATDVIEATGAYWYPLMPFRNRRSDFVILQERKLPANLCRSTPFSEGGWNSFCGGLWHLARLHCRNASMESYIRLSFAWIS